MEEAGQYQGIGCSNKCHIQNICHLEISELDGACLSLPSQLHNVLTPSLHNEK
jgi:hypothetical protein